MVGKQVAQADVPLLLARTVCVIAVITASMGTPGMDMAYWDQRFSLMLAEDW